MPVRGSTEQERNGCGVCHLPFLTFPMIMSILPRVNEVYAKSNGQKASVMQMICVYEAL